MEKKNIKKKHLEVKHKVDNSRNLVAFKDLPKSGGGNLNTEYMKWEEAVGVFIAPNVMNPQMGGSLRQPKVGDYWNAETLISPLYYAAGYYQALVLGQNGNRYTDLKLVAWNSSGQVIAYKLLHTDNWFKENEDLGDIIDVHRKLVVQVQNSEEKISILKEQLSTLSKELNNLKTDLRKGGKR